LREDHGTASILDDRLRNPGRIQKRLRVRKPVRGYGRLLETLP